MRQPIALPPFLPTASQGSQTSAPRALQVLLTSVSSDSHTWNLVFMQLLLERLGP
jgi:methylaspartate mutase sigma subunit